MPGRLDRVFAGVAALLLAGFGLLPLANWIPGGLAAPWYGAVFADLLNGLLLSLGGGLVLAILLGWLRGAGRLQPQIAPIARTGRGFDAILALVAFGLYAVVARFVFSGRPLLIDEIVQVFQARILASGHLTLPAAPHPEFFSSLHVVEQAGRVYGQFPVGGPAMLVPGALLGAEWLIGPLFGALAVLGFGALVRRIEPRPGVAVGATLLFALAPFAVFMSGSHMNHVTALGWTVLGMWGLARATTEAGGFRTGLVAGLGFGMAATIRPIDALAFALPAGLWLLVRAVRQRRIAPLAGSGLGIALPVLLLLWANAHTTGAPLRFGYSVLWGSGHDLGFHASPWGPVHTPLRGIELLNLYFLRLQSYLFEAAGPSLLPATVALALARRLTPFDRYLLAASGLIVLAYFAYWHDGFYLGPRFMYPLLPVLVLWTARLPALLREAADRRPGTGNREPETAGNRQPATGNLDSRWRALVHPAVVFALAVAVVLGLATSLPIRVRQYRSGLLSLRWDADRAAASASVRNALVLVRESWGAELVTRMWALGLSRPDADALYRAADPCRLELALAGLEREAVRGAAALAALAPLRADSVRLVSVPALTGDPSLRVTPGVYPEECIRKLAANRSGFTLFPPLLLARGGGNVYARDLGVRDSLLLGEYPDRPVYLLKPASGSVGADPVFYPLRRDSLWEAWRAGR